MDRTEHDGRGPTPNAHREHPTKPIDELRAKIVAAQEVLLSLERGEISQKLAQQHLKRYLDDAKKLLGGGPAPTLAGDP